MADIQPRTSDFGGLRYANNHQQVKSSSGQHASQSKDLCRPDHAPPTKRRVQDPVFPRPADLPHGLRLRGAAKGRKMEGGGVL